MSEVLLLADEQYHNRQGLMRVSCASKSRQSGAFQLGCFGIRLLARAAFRSWTSAAFMNELNDGRDFAPTTQDTGAIDPSTGYRQPPNAGSYRSGIGPQIQYRATTVEEWKARVEDAARTPVTTLPKLRETLDVTLNATTIAGVKAFVVTPQVDPAGQPRPRTPAPARRCQGVKPRRGG